MSFELDPRETFAENVVRLARQRLDRVLSALPDGAPDAVHAARKDLKKLRAQLRLARAGLGRETFTRENRTLRDAGRAFSAVRDAQVLVVAFDGLRVELAGHLAPETAEAIHRQLTDDARAVTADPATHARLRAAGESLTQGRDRIAAWKLPGRDDWRVPGRGLEAVYRKGRRAMRRAAATVGPDGEEHFHEWRKQVKALAVQVGLLCPLRPGKLGKLAKTFDTLADLLGEEHDFSVLQTRLTQTSGKAWMSPQELEVIGGVIAAHRQALQARTLDLGKAVYARKPSRFARRFQRDWKAWREG